MSRNRPSPYEVTQPTQTFMGKTYSDWIEDWARWFFLPNADENNNGPVVFLRGMTSSRVGNYRGEGVMKVGDDSLEISTNQRVLLPLITSKAVAESGESSQALYETVRSDIENGENPPDLRNVKVDDVELSVPGDIGDYRFETTVFQLIIPSSPYSQSLADYVFPPIRTRDIPLPCVTSGYFVLLKLRQGEHYIFSSVHGSSDQNGLYKSSLLYHIVVEAQRGPQPIQRFAPAVSTQVKEGYRAALRRKVKNGDLEQRECTDLINRYFT
jgi:hypothetical protein